MKKLIACILTLALIASLGVTALAAEGAGLKGRDLPADRALAADVLWIMAGQPVVDYAPGFADLDPEATYMNAVRWAAAEGIIKGYDANTFGPDDPVTREQFSVMLYRYAQAHGLGFTGVWYFPLDYADAADISAWADEAMHWMVMNGKAEAVDGLLQPKEAVTRGELAGVAAAYIAGVGAETAAYHRIQLGTAPYTLLIPDCYVQGVLTEEQIANDGVAYYYNDYSSMEVDIYQFSKEGLPESILDYAQSEAAEDGAEVSSVEVNGIPTARFSAPVSYKGKDLTGLFVMLDAGEDFVELVFWVEDKADNFEVHSVLNSLERLAAPAEADLAE